MATIVTSVVVDAPLPRVWAAVTDLDSHTRWMADAEEIDFVTGRHRGIGTVMLVKTRVGPFRLLDRLEVTLWEEPRTIAVDHTGIVRGNGMFHLDPVAEGTRFTWIEDLRFPWWLGGRLTAVLARPVLESIWRGNLARFKSMLDETLSDR